MARELKEGRSILSKKEDRWNSTFFPATPTQYYSGKHSLSKDDLVECTIGETLKKKMLDCSRTLLSVNGSKRIDDFFKLTKLKLDEKVPQENVIFHNFLVRPMGNGFNNRMKKIFPNEEIKDVFKENGVDDKDLKKSKQLLQYILDTAKPDIVVVPGMSLRTWLSDNLEIDYFKHINFVVLPYSYYEIALHKRNLNEVVRIAWMEKYVEKFKSRMRTCQSTKERADWTKWLAVQKEGYLGKIWDKYSRYQYEDYPLGIILICEMALKGSSAYLFSELVLKLQLSLIESLPKRYKNLEERIPKVLLEEGKVNVDDIKKDLIADVLPCLCSALNNKIKELYQSVDFIIDNNVPKPPTEEDRAKTQKGRETVEKNRRKKIST